MQQLFMEFFRPVALGTGVVLAVIVLLSLRMPGRAKVEARPRRQN
ncbi:MAG TPA: hypothetical protein VLL05_21955 [Terriglobales bacterium]|nr:hypothetical protein [Terriglobales bacterium]